jgi:hypothetical protein
MSAVATKTPKSAKPKTTTSSATLPAHGEVWPGQGGIYICTLAALKGLPARHLIAAVADSKKQLVYGPYDTDVPGAACQADGKANTAALLAAGDGYAAAKYCAGYEADGHTDFFLPSQLDLLMAHICAPKKFNPDGYYWSSTQGSRNYAFVQGFAYGYSYWYGKGSERRVSAFRVIPTSTL